MPDYCGYTVNGLAVALPTGRYYRGGFSGRRQPFPKTGQQSAAALTFDNPELINNSPETSPSHRLERIVRGYDNLSFTQYTMPKDLRSLSNLYSGRLRKLPILI